MVWAFVCLQVRQQAWWQITILAYCRSNLPFCKTKAWETEAKPISTLGRREGVTVTCVRRSLPHRKDNESIYFYSFPSFKRMVLSRPCWSMGPNFLARSSRNNHSSGSLTKKHNYNIHTHTHNTHDSTTTSSLPGLTHNFGSDRFGSNMSSFYSFPSSRVFLYFQSFQRTNVRSTGKVSKTWNCWPVLSKQKLKEDADHLCQCEYEITK